jgi:excisionase family DNA binding protein
VRKAGDNAKRVLRLKEAAMYLGVSTRCVRALVAKGELPLVQIAESNRAPWLVDREDLNFLIERRKTTTMQ